MTDSEVTASAPAIVGDRRVSVQLFLMMLLQIGMWGAWVPKLYAYMGLLGFSASQMGLIGSVNGIAALLGMFLTNQYADRVMAAEKVLGISHLLGAALLIALSQVSSFSAFFALFLAYNLVFVPSISVSNSIALANLPRPAEQFGAVRMGGTIGWIIASWPFLFLLGPEADLSQMRSIWLVAAAASVLLGVFAFTLPSTPPQTNPSMDSKAWRRAALLLRQPFLLVLFIATFIDSVVHNSYYVMADIFLTTRVGIAGNMSMVVLSLGQAAEIAAMLILGRVLVRLGWRTTLIIGIAGHTVRFLVFAFLPDYPALIIGVQFVHGICYAFFFATLYIFIDECCPKDVRVSMQGLFNILVLGVGSVVAGWLFPALMATMTIPSVAGGPAQIDFQTLFLVPVALSLLGVLLLAFAFRPPLRGPVTDGDHP